MHRKAKLVRNKGINERDPPNERVVRNSKLGGGVRARGSAAGANVRMHTAGKGADADGDVQSGAGGNTVRNAEG